MHEQQVTDTGDDESATGQLGKVREETRDGFTLIELSIVLVIIGLLVGGVLAGREMIQAAELRALVSQVDQLRIATSTFRAKYSALPGDMQVATAAGYGLFTFVGSGAGEFMGNGNGMIEGDWIEGSCASEGSVLFRHLAEAGLIALDTNVALESDGNADAPGTPIGQDAGTPFSLPTYLPVSSSGRSYFCASSLSHSFTFRDVEGLDAGRNAFTLTAMGPAEHQSSIEPTLSPMDLFSIDGKVDDGLPLSGHILNTPYSRTDGIAPLYWSPDGGGTNVCTEGGVDEFATEQRYRASSTAIACQPAFVW